MIKALSEGVDEGLIKQKAAKQAGKAVKTELVDEKERFGKKKKSKAKNKPPSPLTGEGWGEGEKPKSKVIPAALFGLVLLVGGYYGYTEYQNQQLIQKQIAESKASESRAWQQARRLDNVEGYQLYLTNWPRGANQLKANNQLKALKETKRLAKLSQADKRTEQIKQAQVWLKKHGYQTNQNGALDNRTQKAIEAFEKKEGLLVTGDVDETLLSSLKDIYWQKDKSAWNKAKQKHTIKAYQSYQNRSGDGLYQNQASSAIKKLKQAQQTRIANANAQKEKQRLADIAAKARQDKLAEDKRNQAIKDAVGTMVNIPAGSFQMGSNESPSEKPIHQVNIKAFQMSQTEVTFAQWDACVSAGSCSHKPEDKGWGSGSRPVINVSFNDITKQFIPWLNKVTGNTYRLPTEAEWEYAARAGSTTKYSWGNSVSCSQARYGRRPSGECGNSNEGTVKAKSYSSNAFGLYDMHGNVWEWVQDCYNDNYNRAKQNGDADESGSCDYRVLRGGSWLNPPSNLRSANRGGASATTRDDVIGFRLAQDSAR